MFSDHKGIIVETGSNEIVRKCLYLEIRQYASK